MSSSSSHSKGVGPPVLRCVVNVELCGRCRGIYRPPSCHECFTPCLTKHNTSRRGVALGCECGKTVTFVGRKSAVGTIVKCCCPNPLPAQCYGGVRYLTIGGQLQGFPDDLQALSVKNVLPPWYHHNWWEHQDLACRRPFLRSGRPCPQYRPHPAWMLTVEYKLHQAMMTYNNMAFTRRVAEDCAPNVPEFAGYAVNTNDGLMPATAPVSVTGGHTLLSSVVSTPAVPVSAGSDVAWADLGERLARLRFVEEVTQRVGEWCAAVTSAAPSASGSDACSVVSSPAELVEFETGWPAVVDFTPLLCVEELETAPTPPSVTPSTLDAIAAFCLAYPTPSVTGVSTPALVWRALTASEFGDLPPPPPGFGDLPPPPTGFEDVLPPPSGFEDEQPVQEQPAQEPAPVLYGPHGFQVDERIVADCLGNFHRVCSARRFPPPLPFARFAPVPPPRRRFRGPPGFPFPELSPFGLSAAAVVPPREASMGVQTDPIFRRVPPVRRVKKRAPETPVRSVRWVSPVVADSAVLNPLLNDHLLYRYLAGQVMFKPRDLSSLVYLKQLALDWYERQGLEPDVGLIGVIVVQLMGMTDVERTLQAPLWEGRKSLKQTRRMWGFGRKKKTFWRARKWMGLQSHWQLPTVPIKVGNAR